MSRELTYGMIAGFSTLGWMTLGYVLHWEQSEMGRYAPFLSLFILMLAIYLVILVKRDIDHGGTITFKEAVTAGMIVSFVVGIMVGLYLMVYVKYVNPGYVEGVIASALEYYKQENASQEQIDKGVEGIRAMHTPFGQFTYGIGTTMMTGLLIALVMAWIMQRKLRKGI